MRNPELHPANRVEKRELTYGTNDIGNVTNTGTTRRSNVKDLLPRRDVNGVQTTQDSRGQL